MQDDSEKNTHDTIQKKIQPSGSSSEGGSIHLNSRLMRFIGLSPGDYVTVKLCKSDGKNEIRIQNTDPITTVDIGREYGLISNRISITDTPIHFNGLYSNSITEFGFSESTVYVLPEQKIDNMNVPANIFAVSNTIELGNIHEYNTIYDKLTVLNDKTSSVTRCSKLDDIDDEFDISSVDPNEIINTENVIFTLTLSKGKNNSLKTTFTPIEISKIKSDYYKKNIPNKYKIGNEDVTGQPVPAEYHPPTPEYLKNEYTADEISSMDVRIVAITGTNAIGVETIGKIDQTFADVF